jgi:NTP pyrophosphatase (non-canonical NTP hydrolase)
MDFNEYQKQALESKVFPDEVGKLYCMVGLFGEGGEMAEIIKKHVRDGTPIDKHKLRKEAGDVLWYLGVLMHECGIDLQSVAEANLVKVKSRKALGMVHGSGSDREETDGSA